MKQLLNHSWLNKGYAAPVDWMSRVQVIERSRVTITFSQLIPVGSHKYIFLHSTFPSVIVIFHLRWRVQNLVQIWKGFTKKKLLNLGGYGNVDIDQHLLCNKSCLCISSGDTTSNETYSRTILTGSLILRLLFATGPRAVYRYKSWI